MHTQGKFSEDVEEFLRSYCEENDWEPTTENMVWAFADENPVWRGEIEDSRWFTYDTRVVKLKDKFISFGWATTSGDMGIFDRGFILDLDCVVFVKPVEVTKTEYVPS